MPTRCKFTCTSKRQYQHWDRAKGYLYEYEFSVVTSGSEENSRFFAATPSGTLKVGTVTDASFVVGADYYLDLESCAAGAVA